MSTTEDFLVEEERLDILDPLRHLRDQHDASDLAEELLPPQRATVTQQILELSIAHLDVSVKLVVDAGPGCGGIAWPAGEVLSRYISLRDKDRQGWIHGKRVLDLGAGTGLVGLVAAQLGANVLISDQLQLLPLIKRNIILNAQSAQAQALELNWGEPLPSCVDPHTLDIILAADCVYFEPAFPLLVRTLCDLTETRDPEILFCYKKRRKADKRFFLLLKKHFDWHEVEDDPYKPEYAREAISLLRLRRRRRTWFSPT